MGLISQGSDYKCSINVEEIEQINSNLEENGKLLHLMIPNKNRYSSLLRRFRNRIVYMNELKEKLIKKEEK